jgi:hypothetical protein
LEAVCVDGVQYYVQSRLAEIANFMLKRLTTTTFYRTFRLSQCPLGCSASQLSFTIRIFLQVCTVSSPAHSMSTGSDIRLLQ